MLPVTKANSRYRLHIPPGLVQETAAKTATHFLARMPNRSLACTLGWLCFGERLASPPVCLPAYLAACLVAWPPARPTARSLVRSCACFPVCPLSGLACLLACLPSLLARQSCFGENPLPWEQEIFVKFRECYYPNFGSALFQGTTGKHSLRYSYVPSADANDGSRASVIIDVCLT